MCATIVQSGEHASGAVSTWGGALPLSLAVLRPPAFTPRQVLDNVVPFFSLHRRPLGRAGDRATRHTGSVPMPWGMPGPDVWIRQDRRVTVNQAVAGAQQGAPYAASAAMPPTVFTPSGQALRPQDSRSETRLPMLATLAPFIHVHVAPAQARQNRSRLASAPMMERNPHFITTLLHAVRTIHTSRTVQSAKQIVLPIQIVTPLPSRSIGSSVVSATRAEPAPPQLPVLAPILERPPAQIWAYASAGGTVTVQPGSARQSLPSIGIPQRVQPRSVMAATTAHLDQVATFAGQPAASARQPALHAQPSISSNPEVETQLVWRSGAAQPGIGAPSLAGSLAARHGERPAPNGWVEQIYRRITDMNSEPGPYATLPQVQLVKTEQLIERIVKREVTAEVARQQQKGQRQLEGQANDPPIGHLKPSAAPTIAALTRDEVVKALLAKMRDALQDERFRRGLLR